MGSHESQSGQPIRPISVVTTEFAELLNRGASAFDIQPIVVELEARYAVVHGRRGKAFQHKAEDTKTMGSIRRTLSNPRLERLGILSNLAYSKEESETDYEQQRIRQRKINNLGDRLAKSVLRELGLTSAELSRDGSNITGVPVESVAEVTDLLGHFHWPFRVVKRHERVTTGNVDLTM